MPTYVPAGPSYGIYTSQLLRICRVSCNISDFQASIGKLTNEFLNKGFSKLRLRNTFSKFITKYSTDWGKLGCEPTLPAHLT